MTNYSSILAGKLLWTEEPCGATVHGITKADMTEQLSMHVHTGIKHTLEMTGGYA